MHLHSHSHLCFPVRRRMVPELDVSRCCLAAWARFLVIAKTVCPLQNVRCMRALPWLGAVCMAPPPTGFCRGRCHSRAHMTAAAVCSSVTLWFANVRRSLCRWTRDEEGGSGDDAGPRGDTGGFSKAVTTRVLRDSLTGMFRRVTDGLFVSIAKCASLTALRCTSCMVPASFDWIDRWVQIWNRSSVHASRLPVRTLPQPVCAAPLAVVVARFLRGCADFWWGLRLPSGDRCQGRDVVLPSRRQRTCA